METTLDFTFAKGPNQPTKVKLDQSANIELLAGGRAGAVVGPQGEVKGTVKVLQSTEFVLKGELDPSKLLRGDITAGKGAPKELSSKTTLELGLAGKAGGHVTPPGGGVDLTGTPGWLAR